MPKSAARPATDRKGLVIGRSKRHTAARSCTADPMRDEARRGLRGLAFDTTASRKCGRSSKVNPVGGAPSRSGFLATPINASSRRTSSVDDTASWEKRCRVGRLVCALRTVRERYRKKTAAARRAIRRRTSKSPERDRPKLRAAKLCHGERFNGCVGTRFDSRAQRRR